MMALNTVNRIILIAVENEHVCIRNMGKKIMVSETDHKKKTRQDAKPTHENIK